MKLLHCVTTWNWIHSTCFKQRNTILLTKNTMLLAVYCVKFSSKTEPWLSFSSVTVHDTVWMENVASKLLSRMFDTPAYNSVNGLFRVPSECTEHFTTQQTWFLYGDLYFYTLDGIFCTVPFCTFLLFGLSSGCKLLKIRQTHKKSACYQSHTVWQFNQLHISSFFSFLSFTCSLSRPVCCVHTWHTLSHWQTQGDHPHAPMMQCSLVCR